MSTNLTTVRLYWEQVRRFKPSFFTMLLCIPLAALFLDLLLPYVLSMAVGTFATHDRESLKQLLWTAAGIGFIGVCFNLAGFQSAIHHESAVRKSLTDATLMKLLLKDQEFFSNQKIGSLTGKFIDFINGHVALQDLFILQTLRFILTFGVGVVIIFTKSLIMGAIVLFLLVALLAQVRVSIKMRKPLRMARKNMIAELNGATADVISNNLIVKTFAHEKYEQRSIGDLASKYRSVYRKDFRWMSIEGSGRLALVSGVQIIAIAVMAQLLFAGSIELGVAVFIVAYLQRVASQIFSLGELVNGYDKVFLQAAPMTEILMSQDAITDKQTARPLRATKGAIKLDQVSYHYPDSEEIVLDNLTLTIPAGQKIGVAGRSGSGKTTLTKLLLRFDDITSGEFMIDGQEIRDFSQTSLRNAIAYVPQEPLLFHRTLRENIAYGKLDATDEEIERATKQAYALDFINKLPQGLNTTVGERGVKLSGGQRQRIAIARAILKDAPILVLDEATSALDSESEVLIQQALEKLMKGRTSIVIAHRLSTIAKLDRIIVLDDGRIIEDGSHADLLEKNGTYARLWRRQSGGFIEG